MLDPRIIGGLALGWLLSLLAAFAFGHTRGHAEAELDCAKAEIASNAKAITDWQAATQRQHAEDAAQAQKDAEASKAATEALAAVQQRFEAMKIAVVKMPPAGKCTLSPEWVQYFNQGSAP